MPSYRISRWTHDFSPIRLPTEGTLQRQRFLDTLYNRMVKMAACLLRYGVSHKDSLLWCDRTHDMNPSLAVGSPHCHAAEQPDRGHGILRSSMANSRGKDEFQVRDCHLSESNTDMPGYYLDNYGKLLSRYHIWHMYQWSQVSSLLVTSKKCLRDNSNLRHLVPCTKPWSSHLTHAMSTISVTIEAHDG